MGFRCPQCRTLSSLEITATLALPPDRCTDERALQVVECSACCFRALAVYSEARIGNAERDDFEHIGYWVSKDAVESVLAAIRSCSTPLDASCKCIAHQRLGEKDVYGLWSGLLELKQGHTFSMRLHMG